jgi:hypothetical protein
MHRKLVFRLLGIAGLVVVAFTAPARLTLAHPLGAARRTRKTSPTRS